MRKKLKPDLNLEEIQQSFIDQVVELYDSGVSMRNIGTQLSLSQMKVRKILITAGAYTSERCDEINDYYQNGYSVEEIAEIFHMTKSSVYSYLAYETVIYNLEEKSVNADRQARYRERKKQNLAIEKTEIIKPEIKRRPKGYMYIVVNQRLRKYLPKDFCSADRDPLERNFGYTGREPDPDENIWAADVVISGRGKDKKMAIALENARCGFRMVLDMPKEILQPEADVFECRELLKERIFAAIQEEFITFGIPKENVENYIYNNSFEFSFVKAKPSFPSQNVEEFAESLQEEMKSGMAFEDIFSRGFNRTSRKFGICREYRSVDMATYYMLRLTTDQAFDIIREKMMGLDKQSM